MTITDTPRKFRSVAAVALGAAVALTLSACGADGGDSGGDAAPADVDPHAPEQTTVTGTMYENAISAQWFLAQPAAEEYGLTLDSTWQTDGAAGLAQLVSGDIDIFQSAPARIADAVEQGVDLKIIAGTYRSGPDFGTLMTLDDSIEDVSDLEGKKVGMPSPVGIWGNRLKVALDEAGVPIDSVELVQVPFGDAAASLERGTVDVVGAQGAVTQQLTDAGGHIMFDVGAGEFEGRVENIWAVTNEFLEKNPNTVAAFQCSILKGGEEANVRENVEGYFRDTLGWDDETIEVTDAVVAVTDPLKAEDIQADYDDLVDLGVASKPFDMASIMVAQPDNC